MPKQNLTIAARIFEPRESTVLDTLDELLIKGVVADGDVTLGVAGIDLIYLRLSALLCAADRVLPPEASSRRRRRRHHLPVALKRPK
jgi:hypothetical protein